MWRVVRALLNTQGCECRSWGCLPSLLAAVPHCSLLLTCLHRSDKEQGLGSCSDLIPVWEGMVRLDYPISAPGFFKCIFKEHLV